MAQESIHILLETELSIEFPKRYGIIAKTDYSRSYSKGLSMHLNQIHSFLAVSKTLNFTGAARQLGVPQSTISRQVNDLESQLGVKLFYRTKRDVQLTDEGRTFLPYAQEIADAARKGSYAVRQLHEGAAGRLSIAVAPPSQAFFARALAAFHENYPEISVDITPISSGSELMDDTDAPFDFWFLYRDMLPDPENFDYLHTHTEPLCIIRQAAGNAKAGKGHASKKAEKDPADKLPDPEDLSSNLFIMLSEEADPILYMQAMNYCKTHRFTPKVVNTSEDISSVILSVSAGLGISFLPESLARGARAGDIDVIPLSDGSYAVDCIAAWKTSLLNPAAALFLKTLHSILS